MLFTSILGSQKMLLLGKLSYKYFLPLEKQENTMQQHKEKNQAGYQDKNLVTGTDAKALQKCLLACSTGLVLLLFSCNPASPLF